MIRISPKELRSWIISYSLGHYTILAAPATPRSVGLVDDFSFLVTVWAVEHPRLDPKSESRWPAVQHAPNDNNSIIAAYVLWDTLFIKQPASLSWPQSVAMVNAAASQVWSILADSPSQSKSESCTINTASVQK